MGVEINVCKQSEMSVSTDVESNTATTDKDTKISTNYLSVLDENCSFRSSELSQPLGKIFLEEERGFRAIDSTNLNSSSQSAKGQHFCPGDIAARVENYFHAFSKYCFGLLSGIALWQCVVVYQLSSPHFEVTDFVVHYSFLSQPMQILFYFLCTVCTIAALDRFYACNIKLCVIRQILVCKSGILVALLYPLCLLFSLSISNIDEMFSYYQYKAPIWNATEIQALSEEFEYWKSMNTARSICVILGWTVVVIQGDEY